ncbi:MAG: hypothetical protein DRI90_08020 [Deltaproteobacteria bacterium]|nr:MAG: hypothetical protein DRI90_08020 [Deltaproteobacteria bacterium]
MTVLVIGTLALVSCSVINEYQEVPVGSGGAGAGGSGGSGAPCTSAAQCDDGNDCTENTCNDGQCALATLPNGTACHLGSGSGMCHDGVCEIECAADNVQTVCNDEEVCTTDTCNFNTGTCSNEPLPNQPAPETKQAEGDCIIVLCVSGATQEVLDDTDLPIDGNDCTDDICNEGVPLNPALPPGSACGATSDLVCDEEGVCVGCNAPSDCDGSDTSCRWRTCMNEQCGIENAPNGTGCNDGTYCNGSDTCDGSGSCANHAGNPCPGPDGDGDCSEMCSEAQDNCNGNDPNSSICNDSLFCTGLDACSNGTCSQHAGDPCDGPDGDSDCSESCNESSANCTANDVDSSACDDGFYCNGTDTCLSGSCSSHSGNPCPGDDVGPSCTDSCRENAADCNGNDANGTACGPQLDGDCSAGICVFNS